MYDYLDSEPNNVFKTVRKRAQSSLPRLQGGCDQLDLRKAHGRQGGGAAG